MSDEQRRITLVVLAVLIAVQGWCIFQIGIRIFHGGLSTRTAFQIEALEQRVKVLEGAK